MNLMRWYSTLGILTVLWYGFLVTPLLVRIHECSQLEVVELKGKQCALEIPLVTLPWSVLSNFNTLVSDTVNSFFMYTVVAVNVGITYLIGWGVENFIRRVLRRHLLK